MACLIVTEGPATGKKLALAQHRLVMIGRDKDCTFQILDDQVSRYHIQVRADPASGLHFVIDQGSKNGAFVNGARIAHETPVKDGDQIRIGGTTFIYLLDDASDAESVAEAMKKAGERWTQTMTSPLKNK